PWLKSVSRSAIGFGFFSSSAFWQRARERWILLFIHLVMGLILSIELPVLKAHTNIHETRITVSLKIDLLSAHCRCPKPFLERKLLVCGASSTPCVTPTKDTLPDCIL